MGKPEASMTWTISVRLGGQFSAAPSTVLDQSLERTRSAISGGSGKPAAEWRDIVVFKKASRVRATCSLGRASERYHLRAMAQRDCVMCQKAYTPLVRATTSPPGTSRQLVRSTKCLQLRAKRKSNGSCPRSRFDPFRKSSPAVVEMWCVTIRGMEASMKCLRIDTTGKRSEAFHYLRGGSGCFRP